MKCADCIYYREHPSTKTQGECMSNPPVVMALPRATAIAGQTEIGLHGIRPTVTAGDYCRHFTSRHR